VSRFCLGVFTFVCVKIILKPLSCFAKTSCVASPDVDKLFVIEDPRTKIVSFYLYNAIFAIA